ncbi:aspartate/ornithine carbamoyltransferase family protein [Motiliproteus sediminis]|uniref:aspartate/ornithine carbamoyltransferase family protein n=1 Tax=Motiliproteus sediminis TaxID=1468178 RepID=UPI001AEFECCA|nr:hypothetical protein [Motiliproteus sediminis]
MPGREDSLITLRDWRPADYLTLFELADELEADYRASGQLELLRHKTLVTAFYQPSTRTRLASEAAMWQSGGRVLGFADHRMTRAGDFYQESLKDTARMLENYGDLIALRHFQEGAAAEMARWVRVPVINCGDGWGDHPTQVLTDLYTIWKRLGSLQGLSFLLVGDMRMRTMHSMLHALARFDCDVTLVHPDEMEADQARLLDARAMGLRWRRAESVSAALGGTDVIYMEPVVQPDYTHSREAAPESYGQTAPAFRLDLEAYERLAPQALIVHSFARMDELPTAFDEHPHACYWQQSANGVVVRRAIFAQLLGAA